MDRVLAITEWLQAALDHGGGSHGIEDVASALANGSAQLFANAEGAIVTEIVQAPRKKYLRVWLAGGSMSGMAALHPAILAHAKAAGCTSVVFHGRKGWERTFLTKTEGWRATLVTFEKEVE